MALNGAKAAAKRILRETTADPDGLPPGLTPDDVALVGWKGIARFHGHFFAQPEVAYQEIDRKVIVWFASRDIFVLQDLDHGNLYVLDRNRDNLSLGCLMHVRFYTEKQARRTPRRKENVIAIREA